VLITFDAGGMSKHPNHISLYHGAKTFVATMVHGEPGRASPIDPYTLKSVSLLRKYISILDVFATLMTAWGRGAGRGDMAYPNRLVFMAVSGAGGVSTAWRAMTRAHRSQMVWFRYRWITFKAFEELYGIDQPLSERRPTLNRITTALKTITETNPSFLDMSFSQVASLTDLPASENRMWAYAYCQFYIR